MKKDEFVKGTIFAYIAIVITKLLGAIYNIPFYKIIGSEGGVLYSYAYSIYNLFLNISISGIPVAVSILISEYTVLKMFKTREKVFSLTNKIVFTISFVAFLIMFIFAPQIGGYYIKGVQGATSIKNITLVIRTVSFSLLIIPFLSTLRGYLQGQKYIKSSSISQVIEQVIRIFIVLVGSYVIINILKKDVSVGVAVSLLGAFIGGIISYIYLKIKVNKNKKNFNQTNKKEKVVSSKTIIKRIIFYSVPIVLISITNDLYSITDIKLIIKGLYMIGYNAETAEIVASIAATWAPKICMIIVSVVMALTAGLIAHINDSYVKKDMKGVNEKFNNAVSLTLSIIVPMTIGLIILSEPVYSLFYGNSKYGYIILKLSAIVNALNCIHLVFSTLLQTMGKFKVVFISTLIGVALNIILDIPLILLFDYLKFYPFLGASVSTIISYTLTNTILFIYLKKKYNFNYKMITQSIKKMIIPLIAMIIYVYIFYKLLNPINYRYLIKFVYTFITTFVGIVIYLFLTYKNGLLNDVFGKEYINKILIKLKLKKR